MTQPAAAPAAPCPAMWPATPPTMAPLMQPLAFAEAPAPITAPKTINKRAKFFIVDLLELAGSSRRSALFCSVAPAKGRFVNDKEHLKSSGVSRMGHDRRGENIGA